jgi:outer membrane immunogenic protein
LLICHSLKYGYLPNFSHIHLGGFEMKKFAIASFVVLGAVGSASAADLAARPYTKAPVAYVDPGVNWTGFYIGAMGGYGWSEKVSAGIAGFGNVTLNSNELKGGFGGGTIGYNFQSPGSQIVFGIEADAAYSDIKYRQSFLGVTLQDRIRSFGSVTGRLGYAAGPALFYVKGGYAWADNEISATAIGLGSFSESKVHSGYTVGGGLEYMFAPSWSAKAEYMYADYGTKRYLSAVVLPGVDLGATVHTIKGGINYNFNMGGPVVARY